MPKFWDFLLFVNVSYKVGYGVVSFHPIYQRMFERMITIIPVTKAEAEFLRKNDPAIFIATTGRGKKSRNKHHFVSEDINIMKLLPDNNRAKEIVDEYNSRRKRRWR